MKNAEIVKKYIDNIEAEYKSSGKDIKDFLSNMIGVRSYRVLSDSNFKSNVDTLIYAIYSDAGTDNSYAAQCTAAFNVIQRVLSGGVDYSIKEVSNLINTEWEMLEVEKDTVNEDGISVVDIATIHGHSIGKYSCPVTVASGSLNPFGVYAEVTSPHMITLHESIDSADVININTLIDIMKRRQDFIETKAKRKSELDKLIDVIIASFKSAVGYSIILPSAITETDSKLQITIQNYKHTIKKTKKSEVPSDSTKFRVFQDFTEGRPIFAIVKK